ncbi:MAG: heavy metal translocating P-type ATPase [Paludibacter sp.]
MKTEKFEVTGMTCSACVAQVEKNVSKLQGVKTVNVNLLTNSMMVAFDEANLDVASIEKTVESAGYEAHLKVVAGKNIVATPKIDFVKLEQDEMKMRWWISLAFLIPLLYISMGHMLELPYPHAFHAPENALVYAFTQFLLTLPIAFVNKKYFSKGFKTLFKAAPNMDSLIAIGSSAAIVYGIFAIYRIGYALGHGDIETVSQFSQDLYFESGATILTLITLGKYLEAKSKSRTSDAITRLMDLAPKTAIVIRNNQEIELPIEEVVLGDIVVVKPGQRVPVDGAVESGNSSVDESALTGESMPVFKQKGDNVLSASINKSGYFTLRATKVGNDTTLSHIIQLVEEASASKAPISKLADKISAVFVPVVIGIAILSTVVWMLLGYPFDIALSIGIAVLVISCPCALGLATPVAIMVGTGKGAEHGILIKSAESLEMAHKIDTVVLDKTGTLTEGKPRVTDILTIKTISENQLLEIAASLEKSSEHPLSEAILLEAEQRLLKIETVDNFQAISGQGIEALMNGKTFLAGNLFLMKDRKVNLNHFAELANKLADEGKTPLFVANEKEVLGIIAVADVLKPTSKEAIEQYRSMGMEVVMLTGDNARTAAAIQSQLGISIVVAEVLPQDKDKEIAKLQAGGKTVAMVGDGINDAPALMRSNLGIAIGAGTDIAIESADVVLMRSDLLDAVTTLRLSKSVMINIKQNLFWAFFYNIIGIPLAAGVFYGVLGWKLNPMFAAAAMSFSSVTVVLNALRLMRFKPTIQNNKNINELPKVKEEKMLNLEHETRNSKYKTIKQFKLMSEKTLQIKGMSCGHCSARVEKVLNALDGVDAKVDLENNSAKLVLSHEVSDETIMKAVDDIGYEVVSIK